MKGGFRSYVIALLLILALCVIFCIYSEISSLRFDISMETKDMEVSGRLTQDEILDKFLVSAMGDNKERADSEKKGERKYTEDVCECEGEYVYGPITNERTIKRRTHQMEEATSLDTTEPLVMCRAMSPITYVGGGIAVEPLQSARLVGISLDKKFWKLFLRYRQFNVSLTSSLSYGAIDAVVPEKAENKIKLHGNGSPKLGITIDKDSDIRDINQLFGTLIYQCIKYDIDLREVVELRILDFVLKVHVRIFRRPYPRLYNISTNDHISKKVTIVTKTFERYDAIRELIASVRKFYTNVTILVADDSENIEPVKGKYVRHFRMPFAAGWFAGRNLVISQVLTKYLLWVDDDFTFSQNTKLETFVHKFENPNFKFDLIAGRYEDKNGKLMSRNYDRIIERKRNADGSYCVSRRKGNYGKVEGFPQCNVTDEVTNFFMAKTLSVREVGFDPEFARVAHYEFFWDGLGRLAVASCDDVTVRHFFDRSKNSEKYEEYRQNENDNFHYYDRLLYSVYKNNLKCLTGMDRNIQDLAEFKRTYRSDT
ncbi:beta-1,4 N-acetylgalactosaminyltransferase 1-like [Saccoglossus kowalevskii]|uniref:Beta-1,4 N-acetylgalactosaminyltransferase 1-like n=1 Tax=Saccoglossus kowalevskii TaxID=10224 RepID=A0ABM0GKL5_SACKO|nr:PREDICTED: beta-1,4 N-acetylgalactosaminyltransferase 1-like [Saccoglossus kowalevskii]